VSRYQEVIDDFLSTYEEDDDVTRFVVLLNCGASEDVRALLGLDARPHVCVVVVDSHRPVMHLANDDDPGGQLFVLLDEGEGTSRGDIPPAADSEDEGSSDDDEGEDGRRRQHDDANDGEERRQRRRLEDGTPSPGADADADADGGQGGGGGGGGAGPSAPPSPRAARAARRRARDAREASRQSYYAQGVSYGKPSACVLYDLAYALRQDSSYLLWLAVVGLTDHLAHGRVGLPKYDEWYLKYETHVAAGGHLDAAGGYEAVDAGGEAGAPTSGAAAVACRIAPAQDFRFGLLREWSLRESMEHSPYVAARLQTYTRKGRERLEFLLAKLGIPLKEAAESFQCECGQWGRRRLVLCGWVAGAGRAGGESRRASGAPAGWLAGVGAALRPSWGGA
jgi:cell division control protein 45